MPSQQLISFDSKPQHSTHIFRSQIVSLHQDQTFGYQNNDTGLVFVIKGEGILTVTADHEPPSTQSLSSQNFCFFPHNLHFQVSTNDYCEILLLDFISYTFTLDEQRQLISFMPAQSPSSPTPLLLSPSNLEQWIIQQIISEVKTPIHGSTVNIQKLLSYLLQSRLLLQGNLDEQPTPINRTSSFPESSLSSRDPVQHVRLACDYIDDHIQEKLRLETIAQHLCLSPCYFSNIFRQYTGKTLTAYILDKKLQLAAKLLLEKNDTVKAIAMELNFADSQHLSKAFHKKYQLTPYAYRKLNAKDSRT